MGVATSAYQIEGACNEGGKGESIWDRFVHRPHSNRNGDTGDFACDHYHRMPQAVALMKELGLKAYRFSIAWTRVMPEGRGHVNATGLDFYDWLVDQLLEANIQPAPTFYHWDLPQAIQDQGDWVNRQITDWFADYARLVYDQLGDRVTLWTTLNEPWVTTFLGHALGIMAPGLVDYSLAYQVLHHKLLAHGKAVDVFCQEGYAGEIGIASIGPLDPKPGSETYGFMTTTPKPGWANFVFVSAIRAYFDVPIGFDTDVNGAALGEWRWGAGQGLDTFLYRDPYPERCPYQSDCFDGLACGPAIEERWGQKAITLPADHPAWDLEAEYQALGLFNLITSLSPQRVTLGGGVMQQPQIFPCCAIRCNSC